MEEKYVISRFLGFQNAPEIILESKGKEIH
jgi:hypothetical protein